MAGPTLSVAESHNFGRKSDLAPRIRPRPLDMWCGTETTKAKTAINAEEIRKLLANY